MKRWLALIPLAVVVVLAVMFWGKSLRREVQFQPNELVGALAPSVALEPLGGGAPIAVNAAAKGPMLINVFGSWCVACVVEHPILMDMQAKGLPIVGVAWRDQPENTQKFLRQRGNPYEAVLMDPNGLAAIELGITAAPESFLVDASGRIVAKQAGPLTPDIAASMLKTAKGG